MTQRALSFVLVFESADSRSLEDASKAIAGVQAESPGVILGPDSLPHLTLLQIDAAREEAAELWSQAASRVQQPIVDLTLAGLCLLPAPDDSEVWVEVPALKSDALDELQRDLMSLPMVEDRKIFNGVRNSFRPHVTLSLLGEPPDALPPQAVSGGLLRRQVRGHLGLGVSGENYSLVEMLHRTGG